MVHRMYHFKERRSSTDSLSLPEIEIIPVHIIKYLAEFQMKGVQFLYEKPQFCVLNDDSGFGKLATVVAYLAAVAANKTTMIVYKNNEKHLHGWQFHLDLLSNLRPVEVTSQNDLENKWYNVFIVKFSLLSELKDVYKKFDILIVDNREQLLKQPSFTAELLRIVDGVQTIVVSSVDITSCTMTMHNVLKLGGRLVPKYATYLSFSAKYKLPDTERSSFDLEDYFVRREILGRLCGDFRLRRVRYDFEDEVPLVEPKQTTLSLYFWCTQPRTKLARTAQVTSVQVISPARINMKSMILHDEQIQQNGSKTSENEDETESMPRLYLISDSEDEEEHPKTQIPAEKQVKTEPSLVPEDNGSHVLCVEPTPEPILAPQPAHSEAPPPDRVQSPRRRPGRPFKNESKTGNPEVRTFTRTRGMERQTRASSGKSKYMNMNAMLLPDRRKRCKVSPKMPPKKPAKVPSKMPAPSTTPNARSTRSSGGNIVITPLETERKPRRKTLPAVPKLPTPPLPTPPPPPAAPERDIPPPPPPSQHEQQTAPSKSSQLSIISTSEYDDIQCGQRLTAESNSDNSVQLIYPAPSPIFSTPPVLSALFNTQEVIDLTDSSQSSEQSRRTKNFKKQRVAQPAPQKVQKKRRGSPDLFSSSDLSGEKSILNLVQKCMANNNNNNNNNNHNQPLELSETPSVIEAPPTPTPPQTKSPQRTHNGNKITRYLIPSPGPNKAAVEADNKKSTAARRSPKSGQHNETTLTRWLNYDTQPKGPTLNAGERASTSPENKSERRRRILKRRRSTLI